MSDVQRYARVPAGMGRAGWRKDAEHTASAGNVQGRGASMAAALDDLAGILAAMAGRTGDYPCVWWNPDGQRLWVAADNPVDGGHLAVVVDMSGDVPRVSGTSSGNGPACRAFTASEQMVPVHR